MQTGRSRVGTLVGATALLWATSSMACSEVPDNRTFGEKLKAAKVAFIGEVESVRGRTVTFRVDHALTANVEGARATIEMAPPSTCAIEFVKGQRWIFGGVNSFDPSLRLDVGPNGARQDADTSGRLRRQDDSRLQMPPEFTRCEGDRQCTPLAYACSTTAVNVDQLAAAKKHVFGKMGVARPEVVDCAIDRSGRVVGAEWFLCRAKRCGLWRTFWE